MAETTDSIPLIFLMTDGAVEDERDICNFVKGSLTSGGSISLRICTFGIGKILLRQFYLQLFDSYCLDLFDLSYLELPLIYT